MSLIHLPPGTLDDEFVEVRFPGLDRPGLLHLPTWTVVPPLSGADDGDTDDDATDDDADAKDDAKTKAKTKDADKDDEHDDELTQARNAATAAHAELKRIRRKAEADEQTAKAKAGEWEELYNAEKTKAEKLEHDAEENAKRTLAESALTRLRCKNPARYVKLLDLDDIEDESSAERIAKRLQKSDPDLFTTSSTRQLRGGGKNDDDDDDEDDDKSNGRNGKRGTPVNRLRAGLEAKT